MSSSNNHFDAFKSTFGGSSKKRLTSLELNANHFCDTVLASFDQMSRINGLLHGEVQSGKTSQTLAVIAAVADEDPSFETFIYLTSNVIPLHEQTLSDAVRRLSHTFSVCGPNDDIQFRSAPQGRPRLLILNKDTSILARWLKRLQTNKDVLTRPVFIVDDEGDWGTPDNKVNSKSASSPSRTNVLITNFRALGTGSIYLSVTATPQSLFLQTCRSGYRPSFIEFFEPGDGYLGGDFFFGRPDSICHRILPNDETQKLLQSAIIPDGLTSAVVSFALTCVLLSQEGHSNANSVFHPHVNKVNHEKVAGHIEAILTAMAKPVSQWSEGLRQVFTTELSDIQRAYPSNKLDTSQAVALLRNLQFEVRLMNSDNKIKPDELESGFNYIVGANSLGRGIAFPHLQTIYYTRDSRNPAADTYWQHARIFGYDRDWRKLRMFMPAAVFRLFANLNEQNIKLVSMIKSGEVEVNQIGLPSGIAATARAKIRASAHTVIVGGVNYFAPNPNQNNGSRIDAILTKDRLTDGEYAGVPQEVAESLIRQADLSSEWRGEHFIQAVQLLQKQPSVRLLVRRDRKISANTGSMLSPNDRALGDQYPDELVITLYEVDGSVDRGWDGARFWMINVKLPGKLIYHSVD